MAKLMAVIAQRHRLFETAGQRFEAAEMGNPFFIGQIGAADPCGPALIAMTDDVFGEIGGDDEVVKIWPQRRMRFRGTKIRRKRHGGSTLWILWRQAGWKFMATPLMQ